ncbi:MAG: hypothetical protein H6734_25400 [Alphaproteobacteria bacterium]|nr:hypothetical protein [Alphaproteobacteria bacterium]
MSKRLNISIPDDLAAALEPHRDNVNVSAVCAEAVWRKVHMLNTVKNEDAQLRDTITRLRAQKISSEDHAEDAGFIDGSDWAKESASYNDIKWFVADFEADPVDDLGPRIEAQLPTLFDKGQETIEDDDFDAEHYWSGFRAGVVDVWESVKDAVER